MSQAERCRCFVAFLICLTVAVVFAIMADCERHGQDANAKVGKASPAWLGIP